MLEFEDYTDYVKEHIQDYLPKEYEGSEVELRNVNKGNGLILCGITVKKEYQVILPTVYLNDLYREYTSGHLSLDGSVEQAAQITVERAKVTDEFLSFAEQYSDYDRVKDHIVVSLINAKRNEDILRGVPHEMLQDLAIVYRVVAHVDKDEMGSVLVTNDHLKAWGRTAEDLKAVAYKNSERLLPPSVKTMGDVMADILIRQGMSEEMVEDMGLRRMNDMYVISNEFGTRGAAAMLYGSTLEQIAEKVNDDLYVIPSSTEEVIAIAAGDNEPEMLAGMVHDVNATEVSPEQQLSEHVYHYSKDTRELTLADTTVEELERNGEMPDLNQKEEQAAAQTAGRAR